MLELKYNLFYILSFPFNLFLDLAGKVVDHNWVFVAAVTSQRECYELCKENGVVRKSDLKFITETKADKSFIIQLVNI